MITTETRLSRAVDIRAQGKNKIGGYAIRYNQLSEDLGGFYERVMPGSLSDCLARNPDVRSCFNHDPGCLLGRTTAGTLRLKDDSAGLYFECDLPDTSAGRDVRELVARGDVTGCSFSFQVTAQNWLDQKRADGSWVAIRELTGIVLFELGPVVFPAFPQTSVSPRNLVPDSVRAEARSRQSSASRAVHTSSLSRQVAPAEDPHPIELCKTDRERLDYIKSKLEAANSQSRRSESMTHSDLMEFRHYLLTGEYQRRDLNVDSAGMFISEQFSSMVRASLRAVDPIFDPEICTVIESETGGPFDLFMVDDTSSVATVLSDGEEEVTEQDPNLFSAKLGQAPLWDTGIVLVSNALLSDSGVDISAMLARAFAIRLARGIGKKAISDLLEGAALGVTAIGSDSILRSDLLLLRDALDSAYYVGGHCRWLMNQSTLNLIDGVVDSVGQPVFPEVYVGGTRLLLGFPVAISPSMPDVAPGEIPIAFGALNFFNLRIAKGGGGLVRLTELYADRLSTGFKSFLRANGALLGVVETSLSPAADSTAVVHLQMQE